MENSSSSFIQSFHSNFAQISRQVGTKLENLKTNVFTPLSETAQKIIQSTQSENSSVDPQILASKEVNQLNSKSVINQTCVIPKNGLKIIFGYSDHTTIKVIRLVCKEFYDMTQKQFITSLESEETASDVANFISTKDRKLEIVELLDSKINDRGIFYISKYFPHIKSVTLKNCLLITNESLGTLAKNCPHIESLYIKGNEKISMRGLNLFLNSNRSLKIIRIDINLYMLTGKESWDRRLFDQQLIERKIDFMFSQ